MVGQGGMKHLGEMAKAEILEAILEHDAPKNTLAKKYGCSVRTIEQVKEIANQIRAASIERAQNDQRLAGIIVENAHVINLLKRRAVDLLNASPEELEFGMSSAAQCWEAAARIYKVAYTAELELTGRDAQGRAANAIEQMTDIALAKELRELEALEIDGPVIQDAEILRA
jgi:hypothetical protein